MTGFIVVTITAVLFYRFGKTDAKNGRGFW